MGTVAQEGKKPRGLGRALLLALGVDYLVFVAADILAYLGGGVSSLSFWLKILASLLCTVLAWLGWRKSSRSKADLARALGFCFTFLGDLAVLLNTYKVLDLPLVFAVGGYLFIPGLLLISFRNAGAFGFLRAQDVSLRRRLLFPLAFYLPFLILLALVGRALAGVGLLGLGIAYGLCLVTLLWTGWEALRSRLYPRPRAVMIALGASLVFVMELVGLVYNLKVPGLSDIAFFATWILYVPGMALLAWA